MAQQPCGVLKQGSTAASEATGDTAWVDPNNAKTNLSTFASCTRSADGTSEHLVVSNFGFTVPDGSIITGVYVGVHQWVAGPGTVADEVVKLWYDGAVVGDNKAKAGNWPTTAATAYYGGALDNWGANLTPSKVRDSSFGVAVQAAITAAAATVAAVYLVTVQVSYVTPDDRLSLLRGRHARRRFQRRYARITSS